ncbi:hypothetical protein [Pseudomonas syringae]|uniref:hypothetical protein n=1 Tax=Pseudomonas syringae TaxID=317 RepID=UPI001F1C1D5A|nr:hypothetical protein [Pseudomonas syringae]
MAGLTERIDVAIGARLIGIVWLDFYNRDQRFVIRFPDWESHWLNFFISNTPYEVIENANAEKARRYFMKNKYSRSLITKLSIAVGFIGLVMGTNLFSNAFMMLMDGNNFIPKESSVFSFEPYGINQGSSNYWIYGEDGENYYYFSYEAAAPYILISKSNSCPKFDRQDHTTWCAAEKGEGK